MNPHHARIVIIGGGAVGCSIAYHLATLGVGDVAVLEKSGLTHGATWHAAGLVGQLRGRRNLTRLMQYSARLYARLGAETGQAVDWRPVGSLRIASSPQRWREILRTATTARGFGFELELIDARQARDLFPLMTVDGVVGAAWIPGDGYIDPGSLTQAYARGARNGGVRFHEGVEATGFEIDGRRVTGVHTGAGTWRCETVVNAAGLWAREVAAMAGVAVPAGVVEHQYLVSEPHDSVRDGLPTFRDPDRLFYVKPDVGRLAVGGWEPDTVPFGPGGMPRGFGRELLASNFDRFEQISVRAAERMPVLYEVGIRELINGPIPVTPDGEPILGPAPDLDNFFVACGFTAGIAGSGGAGKVMAEWITAGEPEYDVWAFDLRRFGRLHASREFLSRRGVETYARYYRIHWPNEEAVTARGIRTSPLHDRLAARGAVFGSKFGWERPNWFATTVGCADSHAFDRRETNWFDIVGEEHRAVRERVALIDQTSFAKLEVIGPGAMVALQRLTSANIDRPVGTIVYTPMCNERGGIECDLTVMRTAPKRFYVVTGSGFGVHDFHWIRRHLGDGVTAREITACLAVIDLCGPDARRVLERVTADDVGNAALPFAHCAAIEIGAATVLAARIGYFGELGYELHVPVDMAAAVYDRLADAGRDFSIADVGYRAVESLRLEKGYLYWSADIGPEHTPFEAGLDSRVHLRAKDDFIGRPALESARERGLERRLCLFTVDCPPILYGSECIVADGRVVGTTTSGGWGYTLGRSIALGYLPATLANRERFEIEAFGERYPATRHDRPPYDPAMERLKS